MIGFIKRIIRKAGTSENTREANPFMSKQATSFWIASTDGEVLYFCHNEEGLLECPLQLVSDD